MPEQGSPPYRLLLLGPFGLTGPAGPVDLGSKKLCGLAALLACGGIQTRERLMSLLWGSHFEPQAQQNLRQALSRLRRILGEDVFEAGDSRVSFRAGAIGTDLRDFETLVRAGTLDSLQAAALLYRDTFLSDVLIRESEWSDWLGGERSRLESLVLDMLVRLGDAELQAGEAERALAAGQRALAIDNLREDAHRVTIAALAATGRRAEALRQYDRLARTLKDSLDVEPDEDSKALIERVRAGSGPGRRQSPKPSSAELDRLATRLCAGNPPVVLVSESAQPGVDGDLVARTWNEVLPAFGGRRISGDGTTQTFEFPDARSGAAAAFSVQQGLRERAAPARGTAAGMHVADADAAESDHGEGVATAAALCELAKPGEFLVSAEAREYLTPSLDAAVEDLGEVSISPSGERLRGFRVTPPAPRERAFSANAPERLKPAVAVIPFVARTGEQKDQLLGEILADQVIAALSRTSELSVISRLSTTGFRGRQASIDDIRSLLNANYALSGDYRIEGDRLHVFVELADAESGDVAWADRLSVTVSEVIGSGDFAFDIVAPVSATIINRALVRAQSSPLPSLETYSLFIGAIGLMHQLSRNSVELARQMLELLIERAPRHAMPHAWLAHLYILRASQGWSSDIAAEAQLAADSAQRALDSEPTCSLALAIDGHVQSYFMRRFDVAIERFELAVETNPSESLAWLLKGTAHAFLGEGVPAEQGTTTALRLSPLDPRRWYYDSLAATAALSAGHFDRAIECARRSIRANRMHTSTFRAMAIAQVLAGRVDEARHVAGELMRLQPELTIKQYLARHPAAEFETGRTWADALRTAGVPD